MAGKIADILSSTAAGINSRDDQSSFLMDSARCRALCRACSWRGSQWRGARRREGSPPSPPGSAPKIGDLGTRRILNYKTNIEKIWRISDTMFLFHKLLIKKNIKINSERERERERFASFLLLQITYFPGIFLRNLRYYFNLFNKMTWEIYKTYVNHTLQAMDPYLCLICKL